MALGRRTAVFLAVGLGAVLTGAGCARSDAGVVDVDVRVTVCVKGGNPCVALPLPDAEVTVKANGGQLLASGKTDESGRAVFHVHQSGKLDVVVHSLLLEDGQATGSTDLSAGGASSLSLQGPMSPDVTTGKR